MYQGATSHTPLLRLNIHMLAAHSLLMVAVCLASLISAIMLVNMLEMIEQYLGNANQLY